MGKYGKYRSSRFLIDRIDAKLGDVNKEIEFDRTMIYVCLGVIALEIVLLALSGAVSLFKYPSIVGAFLAALCLFILPVMVKELKEDQEKALKMKKTDDTDDTTES